MGQDKSDIPRKVSGDSSASKMDSLELADNPLSQWLLVDAKSRYAVAINKLGLDSAKVQGKHLTNMAYEDLNKEKKAVKNELKVYDMEFVKRFGKPPSRVEKEPMRNLYMYYKRLKQYITRK